MPHPCRGLDGTREGPTRSLSVLFCVVGGEGCGRVKDPTKTDTGSVQLTTAHFLHTALNSCVSEVELAQDCKHRNASEHVRMNGEFSLGTLTGDFVFVQVKLRIDPNLVGLPWQMMIVPQRVQIRFHDTGHQHHQACHPTSERHRRTRNGCSPFSRTLRDAVLADKAKCKSEETNTARQMRLTHRQHHSAPAVRHSRLTRTSSSTT